VCLIQTDITCVTNEDARATTGLAAYGALGVTLALLAVTITAAWMLGGVSEAFHVPELCKMDFSTRSKMIHQLRRLVDGLVSFRACLCCRATSPPRPVC
jgi:hypothetical protein